MAQLSGFLRVIPESFPHRTGKVGRDPGLVSANDSRIVSRVAEIRKSGEELETIEGYFATLSIFLALVSFFGLALLCLGLLTPMHVGGGAIAAVVLAVVLTGGVRRKAALGRLAFSICGITLLGFLLRSNVAPYVYGGQDPGVYFNLAGYFAHTGTFVIKDELLDDLADNPELKGYYLDHTIRQVRKNPDGSWYGNLVPGIFLRDLDRNEWVPQFYFLNPMWLAIGQWLFGVEWQGLIVAFFSSLTILAAALVAWRLTSSNRAAVLTALILATNPTHGYFGTAPVSEGIAGFFFMAGLLLLVARRRFLSILPFGAFFLTRITGFITVPLLLLALLWIALKRRERSVIGVGLGYIGAYAASVFWGLRYSPFYSTGIYEGKLGITGAMVAHADKAFLLLAVGWVAVSVVAVFAPRISRPIATFGMRFGRPLVFIVLTPLILSALYRGYLLGFTDRYVGHHWFDKRWEMVGLGFRSLEFLSLHTLTIMLSYGGAIAFLAGLSIAGGIGLRRANVGPVAILAAGFLGVFAIFPLTTPYLYYFGRYLVSELLPLAIICGAVAVDRLAGRYPLRQRRIAGGYCILIFLSLLPSLSTRLSLREGKEFYDFMSCLAEATVGKSVIIVEKRGIPETPVLTPLRLTYRKPAVLIRYADFDTSEKRRALFDYFTGKGYRVFVLSAHDRWRSIKDVEPVGRFAAVFRTVGGKGGQPKRIRTRRYPMALYAVGEAPILPPVCTAVQR